MKKLAVLIVISALFLGGCASGVKRAQLEKQQPKFVASEQNKISNVTISLTDEAKKKSVDNLKYNSDELLDHVKRALQANSLIDNQDDHCPDIEIQVTDIRVRSNFSAVMWGFMAGADKISANIIIKKQEGKEIDRFAVSTSYALGGLAGGADSARMGWLYEKFAEETIKELMKP